ncbi:MAG: HNH endonuclease [Actinomycetes bacterium]|jgi:5-methylcytosine-specific restriction endonuclease McrA
MSRALVLNATYEPLCVVADRRALVLVLTRKADAVEDTARVARSERRAVPLPSVVRLVRFVRVPRRAAVPLTRRAVFARDGGRCVYCDSPATSLDHVIPRSRGGLHVWENVVSACRRCNHVKADRSVSDLGWHMRHAPFQPVGPAWRILGSGRADPAWVPYLVDHAGGGSGRAAGLRAVEHVAMPA